MSNDENQVCCGTFPASVLRHVRVREELGE